MALSKSIDDKKPPIGRDKLVKLLTPARKPTIQAEAPNLQKISITGKSVTPPVDIAPSRTDATQVVKPISAQDYIAIDKRAGDILDNTIRRLAIGDGVTPPEKDSPLWKDYEKRVIPFPEDKQKRLREQLTTAKDEFGNTVYATPLGFWESQSKKYKEYQEARAEGSVLADSDDETNIKYLENLRKSSGVKPGMVQKENFLGGLLGEMREPLMSGTVAGLAGAALNAATFGAGSKIAGMLMTSTVGYDMSVSKYGQTLKENYFAARDQGMNEKDAYDAANKSAKFASGIEMANQMIMAGTGAIAEAPALLNAPAKAFEDKSLKTFASAVGKNAKVPLTLGLSFGLGQAASDQFAESQGIKIEDDFERAITTGGHMMAMDMAFRAITHGPGMIGSLKGASKAYLSKNKQAAKELLTEGERTGLYPQGTKKKVMEEVRSYDNAKAKTPDIEGEPERNDIVVGLTEKMLKLEKERDRVADVHKPKIQSQIDEVAQQIETAKTAKDPFSAEKTQAGVPITKIEEYATTEATGQVKESATESGVSEYTGADKGQQVQAAEPATPPQTDTGNRSISGTEEKGKLILSHGGDVKIEKFDESKIKGGARGELGKGFYFSEDTKYKDYGKETTSIDASSLNLIDENAKVPSDLIERLLEWNKSLPESSFGLGKKEISSDYINTVKRVIEENPSYSFNDVRRTVNEKYPADREGLWSEMMVGIGIDGMKATQGDGKGGSSIRQAVIYPNPKLDSLILKENTPTVSVADKIRKLKFDESILTGGDKGAMQSNIAGLPIAIYNASIEAIALSVEAGEALVSAIEKQIESLKKGGYAFDEAKFKKNIELLDKSKKNKDVIAAEAEMEGIGSIEYSELQRIAVEKYEQNDIYKDPVEMGKALRQELSKKRDTSKISDEVFESIGYDAIAGEGKPPFAEGAKKRIVMPEEVYFKENILTNPKEVFKAMYTAAEAVGKSAKERLNIASEYIAEAIKGKRGLKIPAKDIASAIKRFVPSKVDTETAALLFAENIDDIVKNAVNAKTISQNKVLIKAIKKASKSKLFGTIPTRETTESIDFIASSKVENPSEYKALLEDYKNSISGEPTRLSRKTLIDYIENERVKYEAKQQAKREARIEDYKRLYDKYVSEGKIDSNKLTKEEYVESRVNPDKSKEGLSQDKIDNIEESQNLMEDEEIEAEIDISEVKKSQLKEELLSGAIDEDYVSRAEALIGIDINKIQNKNKRLFNNILEDVLNGEEPSRMGEIITDLERYNANEYFKTGETRIRSISGVKNAGILRRAGEFLFNKKAGSEAFDELGITNLLRQLTYIDKETKNLRELFLGDFEVVNKRVNVKAKHYLSNISKIFNGKSVKLDDGRVVRFKSKSLNEGNSYRIGIVSALLQGEDLAANIETIIESTKELGLESKSQKRTHKNKITNIISALDSLGIATGLKMEEDGTVSGGDINPNITMDEILSKLNERESLAIEYTKDSFASISSDLNRTMRDYFGVSMDMSNPNYIPLSTYLTGVPIEPNFDAPLLGDLPDFMRTMRSGTTMRKNVNLVRATTKRGITTNVYYDFDFFSALPKRYHETLSTTYTTPSVKRLSKIMSSPDYHKYISGKYNSTPEAFSENIGVFGKHIREYVNMERTPFVVTREMAKQRSAVSRFFYGRLINSLDAAVKQYAPSIPHLITEDPVAYFKALGIGKDALFSDYDKNILTEFLSQTSQANRITGGIEAMSKANISIDNNALIRNFKNSAEWLNDIGSKSIEYGDKAVTAQTLLVGYMKGLKMEGLLDDIKSFNLEDEVKKGLNKRALSYAETFLSIVNNESTSAGKAKIFREKNASFMRMLQSFNHNATMNFLIDLGRYNDYREGKASRDDGTAALKRMGQYFAGITAYGATAYGLAGFNYNLANSILDAFNVERDENNEIEDKKRTTEGIKYAIGVGADALTGRLNVVGSTAVKFGLKFGIGSVQSYVREPKQEIGEDVSNYWYSENFNPFNSNEYMGVSGRFLEDVEGFVNMVKRDRDPDQDLIDDQRYALRYSLVTQGLGYLLPFKDFSRTARFTERVVREHKIARLDVDAYHFRRYLNNEEYKFSPLDVEESKKYLVSKGLVDENGNIVDSQTTKAYYEKKVLPRIKTMYKDDVVYFGAKKFGDKVAKDMVNISNKSGMEAVKIINNRYSYQDMEQNDELLFALKNGVVSPVDYALAFAFDKKGKLRTDIDRNYMDREVMRRYAMAAGDKKGPFTPMTPESLAKFYLDYMSTTYIQEQREK